MISVAALSRLIVGSMKGLGNEVSKALHARVGERLTFGLI